MKPVDMTRREFLEAMAVAGFGAFAVSASRAWALDAIENPLAHYPSRDWERTCDLWHTDLLTFLCAPNDTWLHPRPRCAPADRPPGPTTLRVRLISTAPRLAPLGPACCQKGPA
jgi:hypothetical protein